MSDYDDDEYESFDLGRNRGPGRASPNAGNGAQPEGADDTEIDTDDVDEDSDEPEDAEDDEIDLVLAVYREDGVPVVRALDKDLANDLEELIVQLRRLPGDAGALGFVSLVGEVFAIVRVRGSMVQAMISDAGASADWPIAHDIADLFGDTDIDEDEPEPLGDLGLLADIGVGDLELEAFCAALDDESDADEVVLEIADRMGVGREVRQVVNSDFS